CVFSSRRQHTRSTRDWSSDVCSSDLPVKTLQEILLSSDVLPSRKVRLMEAVGHTTDDPGYLRHMLAREELRTMVLKAMADHRLRSEERRVGKECVSR